MRYVKGLTRRVCVELAARGRAAFPRETPSVSRAEREAPLDLASFSGSRDIREQCLSVLTFLHWVGKPRSWTIYSDGTHQPEDKELLESFGVRVAPWNANPARNSVIETYSNHATQHAMGKRLSAYSSHPLAGPTLFLDSDVLFYGRAFELLTAALNEPAHWFLPDVDWGHLDTRYMAGHGRAMYQLNGGFYLLRPSFDWTRVTDALAAYSPDFQYFSDQTSYHIGLLGQGARPLDPRFFVVDASDQFSFAPAYRPAEIALRHYTGPVRHKMWQYGWKWHFRSCA